MAWKLAEARARERSSHTEWKPRDERSRFENATVTWLRMQRAPLGLPHCHILSRSAWSPGSSIANATRAFVCCPFSGPPFSFTAVLTSHMIRGAPVAMVSAPFLRVYKDGQVVDSICLHGQDRWIVGRHAQCDILVGHASTSRRHLEIQVLHTKELLLLIDLHSAHGTMVNGEALTSASPYIVQRGDTLRLGASTRSYKVDWVPVKAIERTSEASVSVLERSSPNGSKASFCYKLGNIQGVKENRQQLMKTNGSKGIFRQKVENAPSPTRSRGQRGGRNELPPRIPVRRLPFANVPASALNIRSPQGPALGKINTSPGKIASSKVVAVVEDKTLAPTTKEAQDIGPDGSVSPNLWLRRCNSAPMPTLVTTADALVAYRENEVEVLPLLNRECSEEGVPDSLKNLLSYDEYPSDKENDQSMKNRTKSLSWDERQSCRSPNILKEGRQPFAKLQVEAKPVLSLSLASSPDSDFGSRTLGLPPPQRQVTSAMVNNLDSLFGKLKLGGEHRCQWHIVVDTNCLLDLDALKSLKQLEGIRETRIIIPKIVLRELDGLKKRHDIGPSARVALRWIEDCMEKKPFWMHVQRSTEIPPVRRTQKRGFMSPTNDDQILECAVLFDREVMDGRVVLLTRDTALKIKAMAEGMTVDDAASFCESVLSPYSERFLWLGSTAYRPAVIGLTSSRNSQRYTSFEESYAALPDSDPFSMTNVVMRSKTNIQLSPKVKGHGKHGVDEFRCYYSERPQGLQVVLA